MGVVFLEHPGGTDIICCAVCRAPLSNRELLQPITGIASSSGPAWLFSAVWNLIPGGEVEETKEGHKILDICCKKCKTYVGKMIEMEGKKYVVLECSFIIEKENF